ncbi:hypothetical protein J6590_033912 [Homalodisca vitripennis]|nr:hypothetical protein J6590_033912 [Homalodisca vitripennis]
MYMRELNEKFENTGSVLNLRSVVIHDQFATKQTCRFLAINFVVRCFKLNARVNPHNCMYWLDVNPHNVIKAELNVSGVMVSGGIFPVLRPYLLLQEVVVLELRNNPVFNIHSLIWKQDGAPAHFGIQDGSGQGFCFFNPDLGFYWGNFPLGNRLLKLHYHNPIDLNIKCQPIDRYGYHNLHDIKRSQQASLEVPELYFVRAGGANHSFVTGKKAWNEWNFSKITEEHCPKLYFTPEYCTSSWLNIWHTRRVEVQLNRVIRTVRGTLTTTPLL